MLSILVRFSRLYDTKKEQLVSVLVFMTKDILFPSRNTRTEGSSFVASQANIERGKLDPKNYSVKRRCVASTLEGVSIHTNRPTLFLIAEIFQLPLSTMPWLSNK